MSNTREMKSTGSHDNSEATKLLETLAEFKADLLWDDIVGVLEKAPKEMQDALYKTYQDALEKASLKLQISLEDLNQKVEKIAYKKINGQTFSEKEVQMRLKEYNLESIELS